MWILVLLIVVIIAYIYLIYHYNYWNRKKIPNTPAEFFFGNYGDGMRIKKSIPYIMADIYNKHCNAGLVGYFKMMTPGILIRSPELIRNVLVQDFEHFQSNDFTVGDHDAIASRNPFFQEGAKWKRTRQQITPAFTSGKLKSMVPLTKKAAENMTNFISDNLTMSGGFDGRDTFAKYTTDNTANCAFGLEANSFDDSKAEFRRMGKQVFPQSFVHGIKLLVMALFPKLAQLLNIHFIPPKVTKYFENIIAQTLAYRQKTDLTRNDFIDVMIQNRQKLGDSEFGLVDILAQSVQFFVNGVESSASAMTFTLYNLCKQLDVQQKLQREIDEVIAKHNGELTYEGLQEMTYLEQVFEESLRIYPVTPAIPKKCTKTYTFPATSANQSLTIGSGTPITISVYGLHRDPKYFPDPDKFDPDRFSEENKPNIPKYAYLPFGDGPRVCLGQRFAIVQTKIGIASLLKEFDVSLHLKTVEPIRYDPTQILTVPQDGVFFNFFKRT